MLDLKFIRENKELVKKAIKNKGEAADVEKLLEVDRQRRALLFEVEALRHKQKLVSEEIAKLKKNGEPADEQIGAMKAVSQKIKDIDKKVGEVDDKLGILLLAIPNIPHDSVPVGADEKANEVIKEWGEIPRFDFEPANHLDIAERLQIIDFQRAVKIAGRNFVLYRGAGARLERALVNFMLGIHTKKHGYTEISPPFLANRAAMTGTGQLPKLEDDMYRLKQDDLFLIPTAEVPLTNIFANEILKEEELPIYYTAYTPCFRREAGSYGKDTRGLVRVHQFDKVEMVKFVRPEDSYDELEKLLENAEEVLRQLNLPYRISALSTGEISFAGAKCYDIEAWAAGTAAYLEVSSVSNFEEFQARRANIKYRPKGGGKPRYVHTLNGSGVALARTVIALLENNQQPDGAVLIPEALRPYMDGRERITP